MRLSRLLVGAVLVLGICAGSAFATEGGGGCYPNGAEGFMAGACPPPGMYFLNYLTYYKADEFKDGDGHNSIPDFDLKVTADVLRFLYVSDKQVLGGFWGAHVFVPVMKVDVDLPVGSDDKTGFGDIIVDPCILSWHTKNLHWVCGLDIYVPTGSYDKDDLANVGRNYWTFEPVAGATYMSDSGLELSGKFMYDLNTENTDTDYKSGQEFHFDYTLAQKVKDFSLGLGGYVYKQVTNDRQDGEKVGDGNKGQTYAVGPQVKYDHKNMSFVLKYQHEFETENRPEGYKGWFKFIYAF